MTNSLILVLGLLAHAPPSVASKVVAFAESQIGQAVGDGRCSDLVTEAYRSAGALCAPDGTWGDPIKKLSDLRPGDVLWFEDAEFRGRTHERGRARRWTLVFDSHVAIVTKAEVRGEDVLVELIHQNFHWEGQGEEEDGQLVQRMTLNLGRLTEGKVEGFRPINEGPPTSLPPFRGAGRRLEKS
jgi:hypothetical protein